jgi:hypothetical protein
MMELQEDLRGVATMLTDGSLGAVATEHVAASAAAPAAQVPEAPEEPEVTEAHTVEAAAPEAKVAAIAPHLETAASEADDSELPAGESDTPEEESAPAQLTLF